jgi:hypothetical protein
MLVRVVTKAGDQVTYRALFKQHMPELTLKEARDTTKITLKPKLSSKLGGELHRCHVVEIESRRHKYVSLKSITLTLSISMIQS